MSPAPDAMSLSILDILFAKSFFAPSRSFLLRTAVPSNSFSAESIIDLNILYSSDFLSKPISSNRFKNDFSRSSLDEAFSTRSLKPTASKLVITSSIDFPVTALMPDSMID